MMDSPSNNALEPTGLVVRTHNAAGLPILWTYVPEMPTEVTRLSLPWLATVRWQYDGSSNNGMPSPKENELMQMLEDALGRTERPGFCTIDPTARLHRG